MTTRAVDPSTGMASGWACRLRRMLLLALATSLLAACSSLRIGYNNADTLLMYSLDSYLELDDAQTQLARARVRELLTWHRQTQLATYAALMTDAQQRIAHQSVTADDVLAFQSAMNTKISVLIRQAAPDIAHLALTLRPEQIAHLRIKLERDNQRVRREWTKATGRNTPEDRARRYAERAQEWFGRLNPEQMAIVRQVALERDGLAQPNWLDERERRQQDFIALIKRISSEHPDAAVAAGWLQRFADEMLEPSQPDKREALTQARRLNAELIARLINASTPQQRAQLTRKLQGYAEDFAVLAAQRHG